MTDTWDLVAELVWFVIWVGVLIGVVVVARYDDLVEDVEDVDLGDKSHI